MLFEPDDKLFFDPSETRRDRLVRRGNRGMYLLFIHYAQTLLFIIFIIGKLYYIKFNIMLPTTTRTW